MKSRSLFLAVALAAVLAGGCSLVEADEPSTLTENRRLWQEAGTENYEFLYFRGCFCHMVSPARIVVRADTVSAVLDPETGATLRDPQSGEAVLKLYPELFPTIDQLFDLVEQAMETGADEVKVEYASELGFPKNVEIDYMRRAIDDEVTHVVSDFEKAPAE